MFNKKEREYYNEQRERSCKRLGITKNQYNWLRRKGEALHKLYEDNCNGTIDEINYDLKTRVIETSIWCYLHKIDTRLSVYFQTDPRGATIYLDTKEIPENNYTQAVCIY